MNSIKHLNSRADLLRWAQHYDKEDLNEVAFLLGYQALKKPDTENNKVSLANTIKNTDEPPPTEDKNKENKTDTRPAEKFYFISHREAVTEDNNTDSFETDYPSSLRGIDPFVKHDPALRIPDNAPEPLPWLDIVPAARMHPFLRQKLTQQGARHLDVALLVKKISYLQPVYQLPKIRKNIPAGRVTILLDLNRRMLPFWEDCQRLCELIEQKHGRMGLDIRDIRDEPEGVHGDWFDNQRAPQSWVLPPSGSVVLVLSDLGQLANDSGVIRRSWCRLGQTLQQQGLKPLVLTPVAPVQQDKALQAYYQQTHWDRGIQLAAVSEAQWQQQMQRLLGLLAPVVNIEPELLRAVCRLLPVEQSHSGLEAALWLHPDVHWGYSVFQIREQRRDYYLKGFAGEEARLQKQVLQLVKQHHARQFPSVWARECLLASDRIKFPVEDIAGTKKKDMELFFKRFARTFFEQQEHYSMALYSRRELDRINKNKTTDKHYSVLYTLAHLDKLHQGQLKLPDWVDKNESLAVMAKPQLKRKVELMQRGEALFLVTENSQIKGSFLASLEIDREGLLVNKIYTEIREDKPVVVLDAAENIQLCSTGECLAVSSLIKPAWADAIGRDSYGLYADFDYKTIKQRMRWIAPGQFLMGSSENEAGRYDEEVLHSVTLSRGYWLADSTVTQELWQAVMEDNPSDFKGENRPVDSVSWNDTQKFINKLNKKSGVKFSLPQEAQWEYACRAGTQTPFSFGDHITPEQVNYDGSRPYNNGKKAKFREETVDVKTLPCNDWGLYEMHGNVWEWCQDNWQEKLSAELVTDPEAHTAGNHFVVRGGSWISDGRNVRSAMRDHGAPSNRRRYFGFRFSLGQASLGR